MGTYDQYAQAELERLQEEEAILKLAEYYSSMEFGQYEIYSTTFNIEYGFVD